jgi:acyl-CoA synthetase (AMP-forming)/AMP-acid ligase II
MTLNATVRENARSAGDHIALKCGDEAINYRNLDVRTNRLANALIDAGVKPGDRIAWLAQNCHRWVESLLAAGKAGAVFCPLNWRLTSPELSEIVRDILPRVVIWQSELGDLAGELRSSAPDALWLPHDDLGASGYENFLASGNIDPPAMTESADAAVLMISVANPDGGYSGSMLSHDNLLVPASVMAKIQEIDRFSVNLASAPLYHIASLFALVPTLQMRGVNVMVRRPDARLLCEAISRHRCTHGFLLGPTADAIVKENDKAQYDLISFRSSLTTSGWSEMVTRDTSPWGLRSGGYGQTETNVVILAALADNVGGTSGCAAPYAEVRIVGENDVDVEPGQTGEIVVRGSSVHLGYWNRAAQNQYRFRNGWWHTGDLGKRDDEGVVTFIGPMGRLIKSGAENVYAAEVERCLASHPAVREAAIIGVPDDIWIQAIKAVVVLHAAASVTIDDLVNHCRERLASYKKPRLFVLQEHPLPRKGAAIDYARIDIEHGGGNYPGEGTRSV